MRANLPQKPLRMTRMRLAMYAGSVHAAASSISPMPVASTQGSVKASRAELK